MTIRQPLPAFLLLYGALFSAFGAASPFLPSLLAQDGLGPGTIGVVLAAGTAIRIAAGPLGGRLADRVRRPSLVLAGLAAASALVAVGYVPARGLPLLLLVSVLHASVLAPLTPIADALALGSSAARPGFAYGWVRGAGSAAFIAGSLLSGRLVGTSGLGVIVWLNAACLALAAVAATRVPDRFAGQPDASTAHAAPIRASGMSAIRALLANRLFARLMLAAALIGGSHALHDGFEVIRWRGAGLSPGQCSVLWSLSVASELLVFLVLGDLLLRHLSTGVAVALSAAAAAVRWSAAACTAAFPVMAVVEPLHGLSFALLHLACMGAIARHVPKALAATAQSFYATVAMGGTAAAVTLAAGPLYGRFGAGAFWVMTAMAVLALPVALGLRERTG